MCGCTRRSERLFPRVAEDLAEAEAGAVGAEEQLHNLRRQKPPVPAGPAGYSLFDFAVLKD